MPSLQIPLDSSQKHAEALGRMLGHWAVLEGELSSILGMLLGIEQSREHMLFNTFIGISSKITLIKRLINCYVINCPEKEDLLKLTQSAALLNGTRNSYVHSVWAAGHNKDALTKIDRRVPNKESERVRPFSQVPASSIEDFVQEVSQLASALQEFRCHDSVRIQISIQPLQ